METKLETLIGKIKSEGVGEAKKLAQDIEDKARQQAKKIVDEANAQAQNIVETAHQDAEQMKVNATEALRQAARDVTLSVKEEVRKLFDGILDAGISAELEPEFVKELIVKIVDGWMKGKEETLEAVVNSKDKKKLESLLLSRFKGKLKDTVQIKVSPNIDKGFRIGIKGKEAHYDFTNESILEAFKIFLSPAVAKVLDIGNE